MKRVIIYIFALLLGAVLWSCGDEKLNRESIFVDDPTTKTDFDKYLHREFTVPYNIAVKYRFEDIESDYTYHVVPAALECSKVMSVLIKHLWLDVYAEASPEGTDFIKKFGLRVFHYIGSIMYSSSGRILGTAEGGKKVTMTDVNVLRVDTLLKYGPEPLLRHYGKFQVIHHEFGHILHQQKNFQTSFQLVTGGYIGGQWQNEGYAVAHSAGYISPYAHSEVNEDFVETFSIYICMTPRQLDAFLSDATPEGRAFIETKIGLVREYLKVSWGMDLDELRDIVIRRGNEIDFLEYKDLK